MTEENGDIRALVLCSSAGVDGVRSEAAVRDSSEQLNCTGFPYGLYAAHEPKAELFSCYWHDEDYSCIWSHQVRLILFYKDSPDGHQPGEQCIMDTKQRICICGKSVV